MSFFPCNCFHCGKLCAPGLSYAATGEYYCPCGAVMLAPSAVQARNLELAEFEAARIKLVNSFSTIRAMIEKANETEGE